jgi:NifB/MoaA-like Fe-S oxidoreductase
VLGIPEVMLREEKDKFLDDTTVRQVEQALHVKVRILPQDGAKLLQALMK